MAVYFNVAVDCGEPAAQVVLVATHFGDLVLHPLSFEPVPCDVSLDRREVSDVRMVLVGPLGAK